MATFDTSWTFSGATGILRLTLTDPSIVPGQTSTTVTATLTLITNGAVSDTNNHNSLSGSLTVGDHTVTVSHAAYPTGGATTVASTSGTFGNNAVVSVTGTISGYEAFPGTKTVSGSVTVPPYISPATAPGPPTMNTPTALYQWTSSISLTAPASDGGAGIDAYEIYLLANNAFPGSGGAVIAAVGTWYMTYSSLLPLTTYYFTGRAHNAVNWGPFGAIGAFTTTESGNVKVGGVWHQAQGFANVGGTWRTIAQTYAKVGGVWHSW